MTGAITEDFSVYCRLAIICIIILGNIYIAYPVLSTMLVNDANAHEPGIDKYYAGSV